MLTCFDRSSEIVFLHNRIKSYIQENVVFVSELIVVFLFVQYLIVWEVPIFIGTTRIA